MPQFLKKILSRNLYVFLLLTFLMFVSYGVVLFGPFFFDDNIFIENNVSVQTFDFAKIYTTSPTAGSGISGDNFYRPNEQLIYSLLFSVFGLLPFVFHFFQILIHICVGFLIFLFFCDLGIRREYSVLGSLLFLLHPIQTEAVSYISGLSDPMVTLGIMAVLVLFIRGAKSVDSFRIKRIVSILVITVFTFFSKENAVILSPLIFIIGVYLYKQGKLLQLRASVWVWTGVTALSLFYLSLRFTIFNFTSHLTGGFGIATSNNIYTESLFVRITTFVSSIYHYVGKILAPIGLHYETGYFAYETFLTFAGIFGLIVVLGGTYLAYRSIVSGTGVLFVAYSWFFIALLPVSGLIPTNAIYLEHWLYIPIIGLIFLVTYFLQEHKENNLFVYITIIILCIYAGIGIDRNLDWADPVRFYENELEYSSSARIYANLGLELANRGNCSLAIPYYREAILINDQYPQTHHNLARCLEDSDKLLEAVVEYKKALEIDPDFYYSKERLKSLLR